MSGSITQFNNSASLYEEKGEELDYNNNNTNANSSFVYLNTENDNETLPPTWQTALKIVIIAVLIFGGATLWATGICTPLGICMVVAGIIGIVRFLASNKGEPYKEGAKDIGENNIASEKTNQPNQLTFKETYKEEEVEL